MNNTELIKNHYKDIVFDARTVREYYKNYPYIHCFQDINHPIYSKGTLDFYDWIDYNNAGSNCRLDYLRVYPYPNWEFLDSHNGEWMIDVEVGLDVLFAAFKKEKDYLWFLMRWG